jgi:SAM-dependent methyltransferase
LKTTDRFIQTLRVRKAAAHIPSGGRILDIGCGDGALFRHMSGRFTEGIGIDPELEASVDNGAYRLIRGWFPDDLPVTDGFDAITMLATLEHVPPDTQREMALACARLLNSSGKLIITVPSKRIDPLLDLLKRMRVIDGMSLEQHYGFDPRQTPSLFASGDLVLVTSESFEMGLNYLFVFEKVPARVVVAT